MPLQATSGAASYDAFGGGAAAVPNYIEEVFSTTLYTGNGTSQTITNNIDLTGNGGLVWIKNRGAVANHLLFWEATSPPWLSSNTTSAAGTLGAGNQFETTGFSLNASSALINASSNTYASWTFRKQPKFFDVVTYTGNGTARSIAHSLGSAPGCVIIKSTSGTGAWSVWHRSGTQQNRYAAFLNFTDAYSNQGSSYWGTPLTDAPNMNASTFSVGTTSDVNGNNVSYVAYLFAHDAGGFGLTGTDNVISCGSFTTDGSGLATVSLGYEPQWVMIKRSSGIGGWNLLDTMRGMAATPGTSNTAALFANLSDAETAGSNNVFPTATGLYVGGLATSSTYIYIAIRRGPMKVPTSGTSVYKGITYSGTSSDATVTGVSFPPDMVLDGLRNSVPAYQGLVWDRLRGANRLFYTSATNGENSAFAVSLQQNGIKFDNDPGGYGYNTSGITTILNFFGRAPSFFDEVCYTGTGTNSQTQQHNLGVVPELVIYKARSEGVRDWIVAISGFSNNLALNGNGSAVSIGQIIDSSAQTSTTIQVQKTLSQWTNASGITYVAYLFATCAGVSKVTSFTGNGSSQTINCGFTGGARLVLIKRTDSTGDWYIWDSARGIVSGNDPHLSLNSTAAEVTTDDTIDTDSTGFIVNQVSATNCNVNGANYIVLAVA